MGGACVEKGWIDVNSDICMGGRGS
jgi:hypothetical protein